MIKKRFMLLIWILTACSGVIQPANLNQEVSELFNKQDSCTINSLTSSRTFPLNDHEVQVFETQADCVNSGAIQQVGLVTYTGQNQLDSLDVGSNYQNNDFTYDIESANRIYFIYGIANKPIKSLVFHYPNGDVETQIDGVFFVAPVPDQTQPVSYTLNSF